MIRNEAELLDRPYSAEVEAVLGREWPVLDQGFIRVVDYMGDDASIVQAARISYGAGTKKLHQDRGLIRFLMRHAHTTPFEMCELKLHVRVPMDCWRQWIRHRTASVNEYSTRYSEAIDAKQQTQPGEWRFQSKANKQGSEGIVDLPKVASMLTATEARFQEQAQDVYQQRIDLDIAREQARKDLPLSTYTEAYWKIDLHNLLHFLALRMDSHAQLEIRSYADIIGHQIVRRWVPLVWEAFNDYVLKKVVLTALDQEMLHVKLLGGVGRATSLAIKIGWLTFDGDDDTPHYSREMDEYKYKLERLGMSEWDTPGA